MFSQNRSYCRVLELFENVDRIDTFLETQTTMLGRIIVHCFGSIEIFIYIQNTNQNNSDVDSSSNGAPSKAPLC